MICSQALSLGRGLSPCIANEHREVGMVDQAVEERVLRQIKTEQTVKLASDLISIPSFKTEEQKVARFLAGSSVGGVRGGFAGGGAGAVSDDSYA